MKILYVLQETDLHRRYTVAGDAGPGPYKALGISAKNASGHPARTSTSLRRLLTSSSDDHEGDMRLMVYDGCTTTLCE